MSWDKLTVSKECGGLSFRAFYDFNLSMLRKQKWNFISNPDSMISRVFNAKYFVGVVFLDASIGHNPSYAWPNICASLVVLKEGYRWCIGSNSNISVCKEPWLPNRGKNLTHLE